MDAHDAFTLSREKQQALAVIEMQVLWQQQQ
jgi:hypothetical protein